MLVLIVGSSGCGKNTIIREILRKNPSYGLMPTLTTREKRPGEIEGNPYLYVSKEQFQEKINAGEMLEWVEVHKGTFYGINKKVYQEYSLKYTILIKDVDVDGVASVVNAGIDKIAIFIKVDDKKELENRLLARGETKQSVDLRLSRFDYEMLHSKIVDYVVENNTLEDLPKAIKRVDLIIKDEFKKRKLLRN